jgi:hypothetical protein
MIRKDMAAQLAEHAILADEPKEERQGCFRCRNRPQPGGDRQLCDSCRLIVGQNYDPAPLADEPKEERGAEGPWHTEPPSKEGLYLVEVNAKFSSPSPWHETAFYRKRDGWSLPEPSKGSEVLAWTEIPRRAEVEGRIEEPRP